MGLEQKMRHGHIQNLYVGNCFLIMINEFKEDGVDKYALSSFFVDEAHMKRCLEDDIFSRYETLVSISINKAKCRNYKKIAALLAEYLDDIDITIYKDGDYTWKEYREPQQTVSDQRMKELAESAISYLKDEYALNEFLEDRGIELTEEEKTYFGIYEDEEDW